MGAARASISARHRAMNKTAEIPSTPTMTARVENSRRMLRCSKLVKSR